MTRQLLQVVHDGLPDFESVPSASLLALGGAVPQSFVYARQGDIERLQALPGVLEIRATDLIPARLAIGIDRVLSFAAAHAQPMPNGWRARVDHDVTDPGAVPRRPVLAPNSTLVEFDDVIEPAEPFRLAAIVISKEPPEDAMGPGAGDPVAFAAMCASGSDPVLGPPATIEEGALRLLNREGPVVCLATGNNGKGHLSVWAEPDWVLAVGATTDESGTALAEFSGRRDDGTGADVVAYGASRLSSEKKGTSFAAPRAARCAAVLWAFAANVAELAHRHLSREPRGIPLSAIGVVDDGRLTTGSPHQLPRYPLAGLSAAAISEACAAIAESGLELKPRVSGQAVRRCLDQSAQPIGSGGGAGFVSDDTTRAFCVNATAADIVGLLVPSDVHVPADLVQQLCQLRVADPDVIESAVSVWFGGLVLIHIHQDTEEMTLT